MKKKYKFLLEGYSSLIPVKNNIEPCNLQKFVGIIRQAAGYDDHHCCSAFLSFYEILSVYHILELKQQLYEEQRRNTKNPDNY